MHTQPLSMVRRLLKESLETNAPMARLSALGSLLPGDSLLLAHGAHDGNKQILAIIKGILDLLAEGIVRQADIVLSRTVGGHEVEEAIVNVDLRGT